MQTRNYLKAPDPFDPAKRDPRWGFAAVAPQPYALHPLIFSAGRDKKYDINVGSSGFIYARTARAAAGTYPAVPPNDPYYVGSGSSPLAIIGQPADADGDGFLSWSDNITNHYQVTP